MTAAAIAATAEVKDEKPAGTALAQQQRGDVRHAADAGANATGTTITDLLRVAVEKGTPVEQLEKLVDLHERMEARQAAKEFAVAFAAFQAKCPSVKKNKEGKVVTRSGGTYSFTYADLDETVMTVRPIAAEFGLSFGWDHVVTLDTLTSLFTVRHEAGHFVTSSYTVPVDNPSGMSPQQKIGAAQTFADRRSLMSGLGLTSSDEDAEGVAGADPTPISEDQVTVLSDLVAETNSKLPQFLGFMGVDSLAKIPATDYQRGLNALETKKTHVAKAAAKAAAT